MLLRKAPGNNQFVLQHLLGTNPVLYTATGWLKATRENSVAKSAIAILQESSRYSLRSIRIITKILRFDSNSYYSFSSYFFIEKTLVCYS